MKDALVGFTGFVGGNLAASHSFSALYNSQNITDAFGTAPDLLVYSGVRAEMFLANKFPAEDLRHIENACENIRRIAPHHVVLISTIGVYADTSQGDETTARADAEGLLPYGKNRLVLEEWVRANCPDSLIVRLPALFGRGIKKNFIYDIIHVVPKLLKPEKFTELLAGTTWEDCYELQSNGFMALSCADSKRLSELRAHLETCRFTALNFTDSRSQYQFFDLSRLWNIIEKALMAGIDTLTVTSEPITAAELYEYVRGGEFVNEVNLNHPVQNLRSLHANLFGGHDGYIFSKAETLQAITQFIDAQ